jgi:hypothetical protein
MAIAGINISNADRYTRPWIAQLLTAARWCGLVPLHPMATMATEAMEDDDTAAVGVHYRYVESVPACYRRPTTRSRLSHVHQWRRSLAGDRLHLPNLKHAGQSSQGGRRSEGPRVQCSSAEKTEKRSQRAVAAVGWLGVGGGRRRRLAAQRTRLSHQCG